MSRSGGVAGFRTRLPPLPTFDLRDKRNFRSARISARDFGVGLPSSGLANRIAVTRVSVRESGSYGASKKKWKGLSVNAAAKISNSRTQSWARFHGLP